MPNILRLPIDCKAIAFFKQMHPPPDIAKSVSHIHLKQHHKLPRKVVRCGIYDKYCIVQWCSVTWRAY